MLAPKQIQNNLPNQNKYPLIFHLYAIINQYRVFQPCIGFFIKAELLIFLDQPT